MSRSPEENVINAIASVTKSEMFRFLVNDRLEWQLPTRCSLICKTRQRTLSARQNGFQTCSPTNARSSDRTTLTETVQKLEKQVLASSKP